MSRQQFQFELAQSAAEIRAYFALRRDIFCEEQGIFSGNDFDDLDPIAYPIVALDKSSSPRARWLGLCASTKVSPRFGTVVAWESSQSFGGWTHW